MLHPNTYNIRDLAPEDLGSVEEISAANGSAKSPVYWERCRDGLELERLHIFLAVVEQRPAGYAILNWAPKYRVYEQLGIPEIQDLNVLQDFRRRGVGTAIIGHCEEQVLRQGKTQVGISFGLTKDYGAAQRLYARLGYIPDGFGVTYDREPVTHGQLRAVDDDLCLMLVKDL